jgi:hypothetical protein
MAHLLGKPKKKAFNSEDAERKERMRRKDK